MKTSKRFNLLAIAFAGAVCLSAPQGALAGKSSNFHIQATELSQSSPGSQADYVYQGRHYPYRYNGRYYSYRYGGHYYTYRYGGRYYNNRSYSNGKWRYY